MNAITSAARRSSPDGAGKRSSGPNESTLYAQQDTVLSPRFYTTDFEAMSRVDVTGVRAEWDALIAELRADHNRNHFVQTEVFKQDFLRPCRRRCGKSFWSSWSAPSLPNSRDAYYMRK